jgi:hypothetical protein
LRGWSMPLFNITFSNFSSMKFSSFILLFSKVLLFHHVISEN